MSIEQIMTRQAEATERVAAALEAMLKQLGASPAQAAATAAAAVEKQAAKKAEKPAPEPTPEPEPEPEPEVDPLDEGEPAVEEETFTEDQVRQACKDYREINGSDAIMAILKKHGASGLGSLKPEHYASVMKEVR